MSRNCRIDMLAQPIELAFEDIEDAELSVFFAMGIVNPFGPTLNLVATVGSGAPGNVLPLVQAMLNPFQQSVEQIGDFTIGEQWVPLADFEPLMSLEFGSCPTLILLNSDIPEDDRVPVASRLLENFSDDIETTYAQVKSHFGDPWTRVSSEMSGRKSASEIPLGTTATAALLAQSILSSEHIWPELKAFMYAWRGSIEKASIPKELKQNALHADRFTDFVTRRVLPACWLPEAADAEERVPLADTSAPLKLESPAEVRGLIDSDDWAGMPTDQLLELTKLGMFVYGASGSDDDVGPLSRLYNHVVGRTDPEHRQLMLQQLTAMVEEANVPPAAFFPVLVLDPDRLTVGTTTIDMISCSTVDPSGEVTVMKEIEKLLRNDSLTNPGAVFGALVWMGEPRLREPLIGLRSLLTLEQMDVAVATYSSFICHGAVQFWLGWAEELVEKTDPHSLGLFGRCAIALRIAGSRNKLGKVFDGERDLPCAGKEFPIINRREWSIAKYADMIAPDLYRLESLESPPKVMSDVLRVWGLKPAAPLSEQFVPGAG